jgi:hypothetical protein
MVTAYDYPSAVHVRLQAACYYPTRVTQPLHKGARRHTQLLTSRTDRLLLDEMQ